MLIIWQRVQCPKGEKSSANSIRRPRSEQARAPSQQGHGSSALLCHGCHLFCCAALCETFPDAGFVPCYLLLPLLDLRLLFSPPLSHQHHHTPHPFRFRTKSRLILSPWGALCGCSCFGFALRVHHLPSTPTDASVLLVVSPPNPLRHPPTGLPPAPPPPPTLHGTPPKRCLVRRAQIHVRACCRCRGLARAALMMSALADAVAVAVAA